MAEYSKCVRIPCVLLRLPEHGYLYTGNIPAHGDVSERSLDELGRTDHH